MSMRESRSFSTHSVSEKSALIRQDALGPELHKEITDAEDEDNEVMRKQMTTLKSKKGILLSAFNLSNTVIGGGVVALPFAFRASGIVMGAGLLLLSSMMSFVSLTFLRRLNHYSGQKTFKDNLQYAFGIWGERAYHVATVLCCLGPILSYILLIGDFLQPLIEHWAGEAWKGHFLTSRTFVVLVTVWIEIPLVMLKDIGALSFTSFAAMIMILYVCGIVAFKAVYGLQNGSLDCLVGGCVTLVEASAGLFRALPVITFAFTCQFNYYEIMEKLERRTPLREAIVSSLAIGFCTCMYMMIGTFGYLTFYGTTKSNFLIDYDLDDVPVIVGRVGMALCLVCSVPMMSYPLIKNLHELIFGDRQHTWVIRSVMTFLVLSCMVTIGILNPDVGIVFGISGATASTAVSFLFPSIALIRMLYKRYGFIRCNCEMVASWMMAVLGFILMIAGLTVTVIPDEILGVMDEDATINITIT